MESEGARRRKVLPCQTLNRQNRGGGTRGRCLFVFDLIGDVEGKKKGRIPDLAQNPAPPWLPFTASLCCLAILLPVLYSLFPPHF